MPPIQENQLKAMLVLLADPDDRTADLVRQSLVAIGPEVVASLQRVREAADSMTRGRLDEILDEIRENHLEEKFERWAECEAGVPDLEEGVFLLAEWAYPDLDRGSYRERLNRMAEVVAERLQGVTEPRSVISTVNQYLFKEEGFQGNVDHYYDPDNSYINRVLDSRAGIPISLSIVYLLIAERLGLPITGVGFPGHFLLKYETPDYCTYLDAFNRGLPLSRQECVRFLVRSGYKVEKGFLRSASSREILARMMRNLVFIYNQQKDERRTRRLTRMIQIVGSAFSEDTTSS